MDSWMRYHGMDNYMKDMQSTKKKKKKTRADRLFSG
jgi:hypothetical protein